MKLDAMKVKNFQSLHNADLEITGKVVVVSGFNGAGKSTLLDAINLAATGELRRVSKKKDIKDLINKGNKKASIELITDEGVLTYSIPGTKNVQLIDSPYMPFALDAHRFSTLSPEARRTTLFKLTGASAQPKEVARRMKERGVPDDIIERVKPLLMAGFSSACDHAKNMATEARGAWKQITGENYGADKADGWEPEAPEHTADPAELDLANEQLTQVQQDIEDANQSIGAAKNAQRRADEQAEEAARLEEVFGLLERRENKLARDRESLQELERKLESAQSVGAERKGLVHDMARAMAPILEIISESEGYCTDEGVTPWHEEEGAGLMVSAMEAYAAQHGHIEAEDDDDAVELRAKLPEYQKAVASMKSTVQNSERDVNASKTAGESLQAMQELKSLPADALANAQQQIDELRGERDRLYAKVQALSGAIQEQQSYKTKAAEAAAQHRLVESWSAASEALSPTGIPSEILAAALKPANDVMRDVCDMAGWSEARINGDIELTYGDRQYGLLSESEKWRTDVAVTIAIASLANTGIVTIDRFDVLELPARGAFMMTLLKLVERGNIEQAFMAGTLKEPMKKSPDGVQPIWIESGIAK